MLLQWPSHKEVSQPVSGRATARPQQLPPSHLVSLTRTLRLKGQGVTGSWRPTKSGRHESSITVSVTPYAMWKASLCFLKRLPFIRVDILITRTNTLVRNLQAKDSVDPGSFLSSDSVNLLPFCPVPYPARTKTVKPKHNETYSSPCRTEAQNVWSPTSIMFLACLDGTMLTLHRLI